MASNRIGWLLRRGCAGAAVSVLLVPGFAAAGSLIGPENAERLNRTAQTSVVSQSAGATSPFLKAAPDLFEATGLAVWDGKRTLQGIWVAHPLATSARRVRIFNDENGLAVDGALFKRDSSLSGASVLISSEAASLLKMDIDAPTKLRIVAVTPARRDRVQDNVAASSEPAGQEQAASSNTDTAPKPEPVQPAQTAQPPAEVEVAAKPEPAAPVQPKPAPQPEPEPVEPEPVKVQDPPKPEPEEELALAPPAAEAEPKPSVQPAPTETPVKKEPILINPKPAPAAKPEPAPTGDAADGEIDPKTGPLTLSEPNLAATQPDRAAARIVNSQSGPVADSETEAQPSIGTVPTKPKATVRLQPPKPQQTAKKPEPEPTKPKPVTPKRVAPRTASDPLSQVTSQAQRKPAPVAKQPEIKQAPAKQQPVKQQPAKQPVQKSEPAQTRVAQASPLARPFVQAGVFGVAENADKLIKRLRAADFPAVGKTFRSSGKTLTRVLAGPFDNRNDLRAAQQFLRRIGLKDAVPVRR